MEVKVVYNKCILTMMVVFNGREIENGGDTQAEMILRDRIMYHPFYSRTRSNGSSCCCSKAYSMLKTMFA